MLDLTRQALECLTMGVLVPALAKTGEVDGYVRGMKRAVVEFVARRYQTPKEVLARHFGKSDRWVYHQLEDALKARKEPKTKGSSQDGQGLLIDVINYFQDCFPGSATAGECSRALKAYSWELKGAELEPCLSLYVEMGFLETVEAPSGSPARYRVPERNITHKAKNEVERAELLRKHAEVLLPISVSYLRGDRGARFGFSKASVSPKHFVAAMRDVRQFQIKRIIRAVEDTLSDDPEESEPRVMFASLVVAGALNSIGDQRWAPADTQHTQ